LAWIKLGDEISSSLLKVLGNDTVARLAELAGAAKGDAVLIVAGVLGAAATILFMLLPGARDPERDGSLTETETTSA